MENWRNLCYSKPVDVALRIVSMNIGTLGHKDKFANMFSIGEHKVFLNSIEYWNNDCVISRPGIVP